MQPGERLLEAASATVPLRVMAAHNGLSAKLVVEAGFEAIWASGFELAATRGLPDASIVTMAEHLAVTREMVSASRGLVVADLDTGFGNAINVIHAVQAYEVAGAAAAVLEDKRFPKMTSLISGGRQELVRTEEFQGKVEAACSARNRLVIIARTEALIAGLGVQEALARAAAYEEAGADFILVHSKSRSAAEVQQFARRWTGRAPLVLIPTSYPEFSVEDARDLGNVAMIIYGNHAVRAAISAMQRTFAEIRRDGCALGADTSIAPLEEVFRVQGMSELKSQEARFLR